jgi:signal transduction histidine kinase
MIFRAQAERPAPFSFKDAIPMTGANEPPTPPLEKKKPKGRVTILRKGLMVLALPLLYQAVFIGLLIKRQHDLNDAQFWALHTKQVIETTDHLFLLLVTQHSNLRAYILTSNPVFEDDMKNTQKNLRAALQSLKGLVNDNPRQEDRLDHITKLAQSQLEFQDEVISEVRTSERQKAVSAVKTLKGKELMDELQIEIDSFRAHEERVDAERLETLRRSSVEQTWILAGGMAVSLIVGALAAGIFSREIGDRIRAVAENTRRIARGEKLPPIVDGTDEIHDLDAQFHSMSDALNGARFKERVYQQTLERRASELTRANRDLSHKTQEIEMFVYSVSHDLRSPLVNLQGFSRELGTARGELQKILTGNLSEEARETAKQLIERDVAESIHYIQTAVTRLSGIIDALLRLSRAGRVEYRPAMVELQPIISRILEAMRGTITERKAEVTVLDLAPAWADPTAAEQIFANLIGNAVNYLDPTRPGKIEIGMTKREVDDLENPLIYYVKDNGLGIADAYLPKVFAVFQRLHGSVAPGEGVGLALVRRMVERHGGKVWVESAEGAGSTFLVAFPAKAEFSPLSAVAPRKESVNFRPRTSR